MELTKKLFKYIFPGFELRRISLALVICRLEIELGDNTLRHGRKRSKCRLHCLLRENEFRSVANKTGRPGSFPVAREVAVSVVWL